MSSVPESGLSEAAIAVPIGNPGALAEPRTGLRLRAWMLTAMLFLVPLVTYWPATFHDYGLRDDYSNLREAHEEVGKVVKFCASDARPIYGWLLQATFGQTSSVQNLQWMRFVAALLSGRHLLGEFSWPARLWAGRSTTVCVFAVLLALVPSAQVIAGWAVGWPYAATALLAIGGFFTVEGALGVGLRAGVGRAVGQWAVAVGLMVVSALIYQPSALFYVVPLAGALIVQRHRSVSQTARWAGIHLGFVAGSLGLAYCRDVSCCTPTHVFVKSGPSRVRGSLGREDRLVPAGAPAECPEPVRAERQQSSRPCTVHRVAPPWSARSWLRAPVWSGAATASTAASFGCADCWDCRCLPSRSA